MVDFKNDLLPPIVYRGLRSLYRRFSDAKRSFLHKDHAGADQQDLEVYWDPHMAALLETWGEGNVWNDIQLLLINCSGRVLDIACGTGKTMQIVSKFPSLEVHGCDVSDFLISKAVERGLDKTRLTVCDAVKTPFPSRHFDYAYSIGSLEHFTEEGIHQFLVENSRIVKHRSFHTFPVSRNKKNNGWIKTFQSYHNNSLEWWLDKFTAVYPSVTVLDSSWSDDLSVGKWFICSLEPDRKGELTSQNGTRPIQS